MAIPIVPDDVENRVGAALAATWAKAAGPAAIVEAIAQSWDSARSAGLNVFTPESWDAMTAETLPPEAKLHIVSHACAILAAGNKPPDYVEKAAAEATKWRSYLAGDTVRCFDGVLERIPERDNGVTFKAPESRFFDRSRSGNDYFGVPRRR